MRPSATILLLLANASMAIFPCISLATEFRLTEVHGDGCVPGYVYNKILSKKQILSKRYPHNTVTVIHDNCSNGSELVVGINGVAHLLTRSTPPNKELEIFSGGPFSGDDMSVVVQDRGLVARFPETPEACASEWRRVGVSVKSHGSVVHLNGTYVSSC